MYGSKGISFTLEAIISGLIIMTSMIFFFQLSGTGEVYHVGISEVGYDCLESLDEHGFLRDYAVNNDAASIESGLQDCLEGLNYSVQVCSESCTPRSIPENTTVIVSRYFIAGNINPGPREIKLSLWLYE